jgi:hypothetical protein
LATKNNFVLAIIIAAIPYHRERMSLLNWIKMLLVKKKMVDCFFSKMFWHVFQEYRKSITHKNCFIFLFTNRWQKKFDERNIVRQHLTMGNWFYFFCDHVC